MLLLRMLLVLPCSPRVPNLSLEMTRWCSRSSPATRSRQYRSRVNSMRKTPRYCRAPAIHPWQFSSRTFPTIQWHRKHSSSTFHKIRTSSWKKTMMLTSIPYRVGRGKWLATLRYQMTMPKPTRRPKRTNNSSRNKFFKCLTEIILWIKINF